jgi:hypothetical protein
MQVSCLRRFRILVVGKVRPRNSAKPWSNSYPLSISERLRKILTHQCRLQSGHVGLHCVFLCVPAFLTLHSWNQVVLGNINQEYSRDENSYLVFHECSGFGPGDDKNLQCIREFILYRTDPERSTAERLHAVW